MAPAVRTTKKVSKTPKVISIDCTRASSDGVFNTGDFETFLQNRIKVEGRVNNLGNNVAVSQDNGAISLTIQPSTQFSKRYLKYLTKKFLKKHQLRDWLRVVAKSQSSYELRYYNLESNKAESGDEE